MRRSIEENLRLATEYNTRRVSERLAAARLATERELTAAEGNMRLVGALLAAEETHAAIEERVTRSTEEAMNIVEEKRARLDDAGTSSQVSQVAMTKGYTRNGYGSI